MPPCRLVKKEARRPPERPRPVKEERKFGRSSENGGANGEKTRNSQTINILLLFCIILFFEIGTVGYQDGPISLFDIKLWFLLLLFFYSCKCC